MVRTDTVSTKQFVLIDKRNEALLTAHHTPDTRLPDVDDDPQGMCEAGCEGKMNQNDPSHK